MKISAGYSFKKLERFFRPPAAAQPAVRPVAEQAGADQANAAVEPVLSDTMILDMYESLGDSCEFAALQRINGVDRLALFKWAAVPLERLAQLIDEKLAGVDDPDQFRIRLEPRTNGPSEYMIDHDGMQSPMHTFVKEGEVPEDELARQEARRLTVLRRKFLEDAQAGRRIYIYRSLAPRAMPDIEALYRSLRRLGPNRLLFVRPPGGGIAAGEVMLADTGFAVGALDDLAVYEASTAIRSAMWPQLLRTAFERLR